MIAAAYSEEITDGHFLASRHVPIRNIWLLMLWASDLFQSPALSKYGHEEVPDDLPDLIAEVLVAAAERRLRTWLTKGYRPRSEALCRVRGRIDYLTTESRLLLRRGKVQCVFEEQTVDIPRYRLVRVALQSIVLVVKSPDIRRRCREYDARLAHAGVSAIRPSTADLARVQLGRNDLQDKALIDAATLALDMVLPAQDAGTRSYTKVERHEHWVRRLFEKAVGGLYKVALPRDGWTVSTGKKLQWHQSDASPGMETIMPEMVTDIVVENQTRRVVIDTKFTAMLTSSRYKEEVLKSGYIYQIYAYLRTQEGRDNRASEGVLLHPGLIDFGPKHIILQGHRISFASVDLTGRSSRIRQQLLEVVA